MNFGFRNIIFKIVPSLAQNFENLLTMPLFQEDMGLKEIALVNGHNLGELHPKPFTSVAGLIPGQLWSQFHFLK